MVCGLAAGLLSLGGAFSVQASDLPQVTLPYTCTVERGRVVAVPAPERTYRILGAHAAHALTACAPGDADRCRTWQIHKFDLQCGGQRVPWSAVAVAIAEQRRGALSVENGRLAWRSGPRRVETVAGAVPLRPSVRRPADLVFPAGYAPLLGTGARLSGQLPAAAPTVVEARPARGAEARAKASASTSPTAAAPLPAAATEPTSRDAASDMQRAAVAEGWSTVVTPSRGFEAWRALLALALVAFTWTALHVIRRRYGQPVGAAAGAEAAGTASDAGAAAATTDPAAAADEAAVCAELIARAVDLHRASRAALPGVGSDNLRDILARDLATVQRTLLAEPLTNDIADGRWTRVKPVVATALADLERIARIITGVLSSTARADPAKARPATQLPETPAEAFEVLGINPEASRTVVKKIVDGLRQSWHPDHARDTPDRERREERMKQINVAWDLIRRGYGEQGEAKVA